MYPVKQPDERRARPTNRSSSRTSRRARRASCTCASPRARRSRRRPTCPGTSPRAPSRAVSGMMMSAVRSPEERRAPAAEVADRAAERAEHEARIREADDEPVVPAKRLEELAFLDHRARIGSLSATDYLSVQNGRRRRAGEPNTLQASLKQAGRARGRDVQSRRDARPPITITCECASEAGAYARTCDRSSWPLRGVRSGASRTGSCTRGGDRVPCDRRRETVALRTHSGNSSCTQIPGARTSTAPQSDAS